jgi:membrane protein required for colicin V production
MADLNAIDCLVLVIFGLSILWGLLRGFLKEVVSVLSWIAAAIIATTFASPLASHFAGATSAVQSAVNSPNLAHPISLMTLAICFVVLFVGTLFIGSIVGYILAGASTVGGLGFINRILGAAFGFVRGYIMVIIFMFVAELTPLGSEPVWSQSEFVKDFQPTVMWFSNLVQPGIEQIKSLGSSAMQNMGSSVQEGYSNVMQSVGGK